MTTTALSEVLAKMRAEKCLDRAQLSSHVRVWADEIESALASAEPVACIDERHLHLLRQNWSQGNTLKHPKDAGEGDVLLYTHAPPEPDDWRERERLALLWLRELLDGCEVEEGTEPLLPPSTYLETIVLTCRFQTGCSGKADTAKRIREILAAPIRKPPTAQPAAKVEAQQREALLAVIRACDAAKQPCGSDPESSTAIRNGTFASIAVIAAQGLGILKGPSLAPTPASVPDGYVMAPHFRGFAHLGLGQYRLFHSRAGSDAELSIVPATPDETAGRVVGDLRDDGPDEIPAELMAVRLRFENVAGLDALEQQLRLLRETHFSAPPTNQEGAAP